MPKDLHQLCGGISYFYSSADRKRLGQGGQLSPGDAPELSRTKGNLSSLLETISHPMHMTVTVLISSFSDKLVDTQNM